MQCKRLLIIFLIVCLSLIVTAQTVKVHAASYSYLVIDITGSGTTSPPEGEYPTTVLVGSNLYVYAYPASGWVLDVMQRNGVNWTSANPGAFLNLQAFEDINVIFKYAPSPPPSSWHTVESWTIQSPKTTTWHNTETWQIKSYGFGSNYVNVTISITGSGTTSPPAGFYNTTYRHGDTLTITAYPAGGFTYYGIVRNGLLWTTANPGVITNLGNVGFANESIQVIFMDWHTVESWTIRGNAASSWHTAESWTVRVRTTITWHIVESWTLKTFTNATFHVVESWTIKLYAQHTLVWNAVETWTILTNATSAWHTVETWLFNLTTTEFGFHDVETWTLNALAVKKIVSWNPAIKFSLQCLGTYIGFDDTVYFDNFTLGCDYITFRNVYMDDGSPIPSLTISMQGGNVSFGQIDYGNAMSFMFYANPGTTVTLSLSGLDSTPYTVIVDGVPMPVDTGWSWDGTTLTVSYVMPASTSHVVLSWLQISTYWHDVEPWTMGLNPPGAIVSGITWYYRSNTITVNSITGYELSPNMDNSLSQVAQNLGVSSDAVQFGFSVYLVNSHNVSVSLTGDVPTAIITRSTVGEGMGSATFDVSDFGMTLGLNTINVKLYIRLSLSSWLLSAEYTSQRLMYTRLVASS